MSSSSDGKILQGRRQNLKGRKPKPLELKKLHGTVQPCRINHDAPTPDNEIPQCPEGLDKIGQDEWNRITQQLYDLKMIADIDLAVVFGYCHCWEQFIKTAVQLKKTGYLVKAPSGYPIINPLISINNESKRQMLKFAQELGLSVIQRTRIKVREKDNHDDVLESFLSD